MNLEEQTRKNEEELRRIKAINEEQRRIHEEQLRRIRNMLNRNFNFSSRPISEEVLQKLNKFVFNSDIRNNNRNIEKINCCICLNDIKKGEEVVKLPCNHIHHWNCCINWLRIKNICPMCKFEIKQ